MPRQRIIGHEAEEEYKPVLIRLKRLLYTQVQIIAAAKRKRPRVYIEDAVARSVAKDVALMRTAVTTDGDLDLDKVLELFRTDGE